MSFWSSFTGGGSSGGGTDWGALAGAAVSLFNGAQGSKAAKKNSKTADKTAAAQNDLIWRMYNADNARMQPFLNTSYAANDRLSALFGLGSPDQTPEQVQQAQQSAFDQFRATPGYQAGMSEMLRGVQSGAAARGQLNSGKTLLDLARRSGDYFDQQAYRPHVSDLMQISGRGQAQASQQGQMGMNAANSAGANLGAASIARQNSTYAANQARQQGLYDAAGFFGDWYGGRG